MSFHTLDSITTQYIGLLSFKLTPYSIHWYFVLQTHSLLNTLVFCPSNLLPYSIHGSSVLQTYSPTQYIGLLSFKLDKMTSQLLNVSISMSISYKVNKLLISDLLIFIFDRPRKRLLEVIKLLFIGPFNKLV